MLATVANEQIVELSFESSNGNDGSDEDEGTGEGEQERHLKSSSNEPVPSGRPHNITPSAEEEERGSEPSTSSQTPLVLLSSALSGPAVVPESGVIVEGPEATEALGALLRAAEGEGEGEGEGELAADATVHISPLSSSLSDDGEGDSDDGIPDAPFFSAPPRGFRVELSPFNELWSLVMGWVSYRSIDYLAEDDDRAAASLGQARAEQARQAGEGAEAQRRASFARRLSGALSAVCVAVGAEERESAAAQAAGADFASTVTLMHQADGGGDLDAAALLSGPQWQLLAVALIRALAQRRLASALRPRLRDDAAWEEVVSGLGFTPYHVASLEMLLTGSE